MSPRPHPELFKRQSQTWKPDLPDPKAIAPPTTHSVAPRTPQSAVCCLILKISNRSGACRGHYAKETPSKS